MNLCEIESMHLHGPILQLIHQTSKFILKIIKKKNALYDCLIILGLLHNSTVRKSPVHMHYWYRVQNPLSFLIYSAWLPLLTVYNTYSYDKDPYMECKNGEEVPDGKVCVQKMATFGEECTHLNHYGYLQGRPCVLLTLKLVQIWPHSSLCSCVESFSDWVYYLQ